MPFENNVLKISNKKYVENFVEEFGIIHTYIRDITILREKQVISKMEY